MKKEIIEVCDSYDDTDVSDLPAIYRAYYYLTNRYLYNDGAIFASVKRMKEQQLWMNLSRADKSYGRIVRVDNKNNAVYFEGYNCGFDQRFFFEKGDIIFLLKEMGKK